MHSIKLFPDTKEVQAYIDSVYKLHITTNKALLEELESLITQAQALFNSDITYPITPAKLEYYEECLSVYTSHYGEADALLMKYNSITNRLIATPNIKRSKHIYEFSIGDAGKIRFYLKRFSPEYGMPKVIGWLKRDIEAMQRS